MPCIPREYIQIISISLFLIGLLSFLSGAFETAAIITGTAFYIVIMSESILLARVQGEMSSSIEVLRKKQEDDVRELLDFLRHMQLDMSPLSSIAGAQKLSEKTHFPSLVCDTTHQIVSANKHMHNLLGWDSKARDLNGTPVYLINDPAVLSTIGGLATRPDVQKKDAMASHYVYMHKSGHRVFGQLVVQKIKNEGFFAIFYPSKDLLINREELLKITGPGEV